MDEKLEKQRKPNAWTTVAYYFFGGLAVIALWLIIDSGGIEHGGIGAVLFGVPVYGFVMSFVAAGFAIVSKPHIAKPLAIYAGLTLLIGFGVCTVSFTAAW